jgi:hypothetical protein
VSNLSQFRLRFSSEIKKFSSHLDFSQLQAAESQLLADTIAILLTFPSNFVYYLMKIYIGSSLSAVERPSRCNNVGLRISLGSTVIS